MRDIIIIVLKYKIFLMPHQNAVKPKRPLKFFFEIFYFLVERRSKRSFLSAPHIPETSVLFIRTIGYRYIFGISVKNTTK